MPAERRRLEVLVGAWRTERLTKAARAPGARTRGNRFQTRTRPTALEGRWAAGAGPAFRLGTGLGGGGPAT